MPKRKAAVVDDAPAEPVLRRSTRRKSTALENDNHSKASPAPGVISDDSPETKKQKQKNVKTKTETDDKQPATATKGKKKRTNASVERKPKGTPPKTNAKPAKPDNASSSSTPKADTHDSSSTSEKSYWLLKAEPESRFENGIDVKFSIDDLASKTEPEPWDGIRNYVARNNLRAMKKGDLAFFYHSNCKEPGLVGTMEIVQEHSPDLSAHDPKAPYYDASSKPTDPKWSVVHVEFRSKFAQPIGLKELREMGKPGEPLETMQMLKQSRLSVSRVSAAEWEYLMDVVEKRGGLSKTA